MAEGGGSLEGVPGLVWANLRLLETRSTLRGASGADRSTSRTPISKSGFGLTRCMAQIQGSETGGSRMYRCWLVLVLVGTVLPGASAAEAFSRDWLGASFAPCEGFGVHGAYRIYLSGRTTGSGQERSLVYVSVYVSTAAKNLGTLRLTAAIQKRAPGDPGEKILLTRPTVPTGEEQPGALDSSRLYLPHGTTVRVPAGTTLRVEVTPSVETPQGSCVLTPDSHDLTI